MEVEVEVVEVYLKIAMAVEFVHQYCMVVVAAVVAEVVMGVAEVLVNFAHNL